MLQVVFILDQYKIGVEDVTEMMWDNEREMNPGPQLAPSPYHFPSKNPAWGAPATVRRLGTASPSRAGKPGTEPGSARGCSTSRLKSAGRSPPARDRDPNSRSGRVSSSGSSRGPRTAKDSESPRAGLMNPPLEEVCKTSSTSSKTDRGSHGEETPKASDKAELKVPHTLFSRRRGHIVANPDEKNEADTKQVKEDSELCEENGDGCHSLNPFSYVSNWPRPVAVNSDVPGAVAQAYQAEITPADEGAASLSVNTNSTDAEGKYSVRKTSEDILFAGKKDSNFFAQKFGEKPRTENPTAVRPVASVTPQVNPKPDLGRHGTGGVPKASEDLLFGSRWV